jgi:N-acetylglucosaminyldiphosphoundecaprenol N-acetyl-beta-D-mannosaminyltransferase
MRNAADILGVPVDRVTMEEALDKIKGFLSDSTTNAIYTPNSEIMMAAQRDAGLKRILCEGSLVVADGAGVVLASKILKQELPEKVSGFDLTLKTFEMAKKRKISFFLFGGKPGTAEDAAKRIITDYPGVEIAGYRNGYFNSEEEADIIDEINSSGADVLLAALGAPKQEKWIHEHKEKLNVKVCIGVGGTLDVLAGRAALAPPFFRKNGLEWLYRLYKEPWRFKRMLDLPRFMLTVLRERTRV